MSNWEDGRYGFSYLKLGHWRVSLGWHNTGVYDFSLGDARCQIAATDVAEARIKAEAIALRMLETAISHLPQR